MRRYGPIICRRPRGCGLTGSGFCRKDVLVIPVADLVRMKLTSFRLKDQVHVKALESAGLITPAVEVQLPSELIARLQQTRLTE